MGRTDTTTGESEALQGVESSSEILRQRIAELDAEVASLASAVKLAEASAKSSEKWRVMAGRLTTDLENSSLCHAEARGDASFWRGVAFCLDAEKASGAAVGRNESILQKNSNQGARANYRGDLYSERT